MTRLVQLLVLLSFCVFLVGVPQGSFAQDKLIRRTAVAQPGAAAPSSTFRQEPSLVRLTYRDPSPLEKDEEIIDSPPVDYNPLRKPNCNSIVGQMECVQWHMANQGAATNSSSDRNGSSNQDADQTARATIRVTPDYVNLYPNTNLNLYQLQLTIELAEYEIGDTVRPEIIRQLQQEIEKTIARIRNDVPRFLNDEERLDLIGGGQVRLKLVDTYGGSIMSHHQLFNRPRTSLLLKRRPIGNKPSIRFVTLEEDGRYRILQEVTIDQPFHVQAFFPGKLDGPPAALVIDFAGQQLVLPLTQTAQDDHIWRTAAILPILDPDLAAPDTGDSTETTDETDSGLEAPPTILPASAEPDTTRTNDQPDRPAATIESDSTSAPVLDRRIEGRRLVLEPFGKPKEPLLPPSLTKSLTNILSRRDLARPLNNGSNDAAATTSAPDTARQSNDAPNNIRAGIDPATPFTPGQIRTGATPNQRSRPSPLAKLIALVGADDDRVKTLLADGIQLTDEQEAATILAEFAASQKTGETAQ